MDGGAAFFHHGFRSPDGDGDDGRAGGLGEVERAALEGEQAAGAGAGAFDEDEQAEAVRKNFGGLLCRLHGGLACAVAVDGDEAAKAHGRAKQGDAHERAFEHDDGHAGQHGDKGRRIEIADVIGHVNAGAACWDVAAALDVESDAGGAEAGVGDPLTGAIKRAHVAGEQRPRDEDKAGGDAEAKDDEECFEGGEHGLRLKLLRYDTSAWHGA